MVEIKFTDYNNNESIHYFNTGSIYHRLNFTRTINDCNINIGNIKKIVIPVRKTHHDEMNTIFRAIDLFGFTNLQEIYVYCECEEIICPNISNLHLFFSYDKKIVYINYTSFFKNYELLIGKTDNVVLRY